MQPYGSGGPIAAACSSSGYSAVEIRQVWQANLDAEINAIGELIDAFPIVAMDTEFPGVVIGKPFPSEPPDRIYENIRANVNLLHLIQLGLALADENGRIAGGRVWQFNFREFDASVHRHNKESIRFLTYHGVDFTAQRARGISAVRFAELLMSSGAVLSGDVTWVTFHGISDIIYLIKCRTGEALPDTLGSFRQLCGVFFANLYDVKILRGYRAPPLYGGFEKVAWGLGVQRVGTFHNAGSDALLTVRCYLAMKRDPRFGARLGT